MGAMKRLYTERQFRPIEGRRMRDIFPDNTRQSVEARRVTVGPYKARPKAAK
jgi:hypothetical protein